MQLFLLRKGWKQGRMKAGCMRIQKDIDHPTAVEAVCEGIMQFIKISPQAIFLSGYGLRERWLDRGPGSAGILLAILQLLGLCEWPVLTQRDHLDHSPTSSLNAGGVWQTIQYRKDFSCVPREYLRSKTIYVSCPFSSHIKWPMVCMPLQARCSMI